MVGRSAQKASCVSSDIFFYDFFFVNMHNQPNGFLKRDVITYWLKHIWKFLLYVSARIYSSTCKLLKLFSIDYFDQHIILHEISLNIYFSIQNCSCLLWYFFTQIILVKILKLLCELCRAK